MDQGLIDKNSLVVDHNVKPSSEFINYIHLNNSLKKFFFTYKIIIFNKFFFKKNFIKNIFIPHSDGILSKYLVKNYLKLGLDINLYHEGVLSIYDENENPKRINYRKFFFALFFFMYHNYKSSLFPIHQSKNFYSPFIKNSIHIPKEKIISFKLPNYKFKNSEINSNTALFIGQPNYFFPKKFKKKLLNIFSDNDINHCLYKPHPVEKKSIIVRSDFEKIDFIDKNISIETLAPNISPKIVVSGLSSALIHLKLTNPETKFYSIVPKGSDVFARKSIIKFFKMNEINII